MSHIEEGRFDPRFVITHKGKLSDEPDLYRAFRDKLGGCIKVILQPCLPFFGRAYAYAACGKVKLPRAMP
jgi:hypothetical protein